MKDTQNIWSAIILLTTQLQKEHINHTFIETTALWLQGFDLPEPEEITISIQWDQFSLAVNLFQSKEPNEIENSYGSASFRFWMGNQKIHIICFFNTVIVTDPYRMSINHLGQTIWVKSFEYYLKHWNQDDPRMSWIKAYVNKRQEEHSSINKSAWNQDNYQAWVNNYGTPHEAAQRIKKDPIARLKRLYPYLGEVSGKKVINLLGSHGSKAVALALLGAKATIVDISSENARYAEELAKEAGVEIHYIVSDVLHLPCNELTCDYDIVLMEGGVLHYFTDLLLLTEVIAKLLKPGGRLVLHDFHPISTKLISSKGKKHKVTGNYFDTSLEYTDVAFSKLLSGQQELKKARLRKWTMGEIVTSIASAGLFIRILEEEPNTKIDDMGIPKTFTILAEKLNLDH